MPKIPLTDDIDDAALLKMRIRSLGISIAGTELEKNIEQLYSELDAKGLIFHPPCYLADEWLCPDKEPVIGIPFYLAHPRLIKLEKNMMMEVEGETKAEFMKLLRHEAGHTYNYAYKLYKKPSWRKMFGAFSEDYPDRYIPRPYSKKYVRHLENSYAQYHPDEDFAETFAVWLTPKLEWKDEYKGWKVALKKLEYVDSIMADIKERPPLYTCHKRYWSADKLSQTLGFFYKKKCRDYAEDLPGFFDPDLKRIFRERGQTDSKERADAFIRRHRIRIVRSIGMWTGKNNFVINKILKSIIATATKLDLHRYINEEETLLELSSYVNTLVVNYLFTGRLKR